MKLKKSTKAALAGEIKAALHASRDCLRNNHVDTTTITFDARDGYYGEAFGILRAMSVMGFGSFGAVNDQESLDHWFEYLKSEVLKEENFGGSGECAYCLSMFGRDDADVALRARFTSIKCSDPNCGEAAYLCINDSTREPLCNAHITDFSTRKITLRDRTEMMRMRLYAFDYDGYRRALEEIAQKKADASTNA